MIYTSLKTKSGITGYARIGAGAPIVLIVGYSGTLFHWNNVFINELAQFFSVYLIDNRNIGLSTSSNPVTMEGLADDVIDFIDAAHLINPILLGWSMGGMIGQTVVRKYNNISGLVLVASVPHPKYTSTQFVNLLINKSTIDQYQFQIELYKIFFSAEETDWKAVIKDSGLQIESYHYRFNILAKTTQDTSIASWNGMSDTDLSKITMKSLILRARNDWIVGYNSVEYFTSHLTAAKYIEYAKGGHFFLHQQPKELANDISIFLNQ